MAKEDNLIPFKPGHDPRRGKKPKGAKHLSTHIQDMLNDPNFEAMILDSKEGFVKYKGTPIEAIIAVAIQKALFDKEKGQQWAEWLAKHGYGSKLTIDVGDPVEEVLRRMGLGGEDAREVEETSRTSSEDVS